MQSHFLDRFLEIEKKVWHPCPEDEDWLLVYVRVRAEESARETVMETLLCQPGKQLLSYF